MDKQKILILVKNFKEPLGVIMGILLYFLFSLLSLPQVAFFFIVISIVLGSYQLFIDFYHSLRQSQYALDYIAILAILVSFFTQEYLVCAVIALMISSGKNLEEYGVSQAKKSLTLLVSRIPQDVTLLKKGHPDKKIHLKKVAVGQEILIRKGEVIPLDGLLLSSNGQTDESSLTGEPYFIDKMQHDLIRSGTVNVGDAMIIRVTKIEKDSTYRKIIQMVQQAQGEKAPLVRLADRYSTYFTVITLLIATIGFFFAGGLRGVLAVLVVATPCPLILATPIALLGGMNAAAKRRIIIKKLASLETLSRITTIVFDKTGTITIGKPRVTEIIVKDITYSIEKVLAITSGIERNSLHPIAKAIVSYAHEKQVKPKYALSINETIGSGIKGNIDGKEYSIKKATKPSTGVVIELRQKQRLIARLLLTDEIKDSSRQYMQQLHASGINLHIFTGDKEREAKRIANQLGTHVIVEAEMKPEDKKTGIEELQKKGNVVAMLGDGINDAPALATADVGLVFSNEEQTAASEASDIVLLGGDFELVQTTLEISKRTIQIALQSIRWGIGLSILCMIAAAFGFIPPLFGAAIQEAIDVAVIINALRTSKV